MTQTIQHFGLTEDQIIRKDNNFYLSLSKISEILEVPIDTVRKTIQRNRQEFGELWQDIVSSQQGTKEGYILDEEQIYLVCMLLRSSSKAKEFRQVLAKTLKMIRNKEFVHITEVERMVESAAVLNKINPSKLGRYKKFRAFGLNRREACKALNLPYITMKKADAVLGIKGVHSADHLKQYRIKSHNAQLKEAN